MAITSKTHYDAIIEVVNRQNGTNFTTDDVNPTNMRYEKDTPTDAKIDLTAEPDGPYTGMVVIEYKRQPIEFVLSSLGPLEISHTIAEDADAIEAFVLETWLARSPVPWDQHINITVNIANKTVLIDVTKHWIAYGTNEVPYTVTKPQMADLVENRTLNAFTEEDVATPAVDIPIG